MRSCLRGLSGLTALALIAILTATATAQQVPVRVVLGSEGTLYVVQGSNSWTLVPGQAVDSDVAGLNPVGEIDGTFPNQLFTVQTPAAPLVTDRVRVVQASDGSLYAMQRSDSWTLVPDQISDSDLAALEQRGELDDVIPTELFAPSAIQGPTPNSPVQAPRPGSVFTISTIAGTGKAGFSGDGGPATAAQLNQPTGLAVGTDGSVYIADSTNGRVRRVTPDGKMSTFAGKGSTIPLGSTADSVPATSALLFGPSAVAVSADGTVYVVDTNGQRVRKITPGGLISTVAGTGVLGFSGDGGPATAAQLALPYGVAVGPDGSVYIDDANNNRIRKVTPQGTISTIAGSGLGGYSDDGGPALAARSQPLSVAVGPDGSVYFGDASARIRRVAPDGMISTVAGNAKATFSPTFPGDDGPATQIAIYGANIAVSPDGNVYLADTGSHRIRRVSPDGTISTVAGTGTAGYAGDGGPALAAKLLSPRDVAIGADGSIYVADNICHCVRRLTP